MAVTMTVSILKEVLDVPALLASNSRQMVLPAEVYVIKCKNDFTVI